MPLTNTVARYQGEKLNKKADMLLSNFTQEIQKYDFKRIQTPLMKSLQIMRASL